MSDNYKLKLNLNPVTQLKISWATLVTYRDIALENNDFHRVTLYCEVIKDLAAMIQGTGDTLPELDNEEFFPYYKKDNDGNS